MRMLWCQSTALLLPLHRGLDVTREGVAKDLEELLAGGELLHGHARDRQHGEPAVANLLVAHREGLRLGLRHQAEGVEAELARGVARTEGAHRDAGLLPAELGAVDLREEDGGEQDRASGLAILGLEDHVEVA